MRPRKSVEEIEVKLPVADPAALRERLARLRARLIEPRVHEMNTLYDTPDRSLLRSGRILRVRVATPAPARAKRARRSHGRPGARFAGAVWLTYKGAPPRRSSGRYKVREEREARVSDAAELAAILEGLRLAPSFRYEKYRTTYRLPRVPDAKIEFDETPVGDFLEIEGPRSAIDRAAAALGFSPSDYITRSYADLFAESQRAKPSFPRVRAKRKPSIARGDMLFPPTGRARRR
jgi:adenylate cyclase class 2